MKRIVSLFAATLILSACPGGDGGGGSAAPLCPEPEEIPSSVTSLVEVGVECRNVEATSHVTVRDGGTLRIAPGTTVSFASGISLTVQGGGIIDAVGTEGAPITLKGQETVPGYWRGVVLSKAASTQNRLAHVIIESAGSAAAIYADGPGGLTVQDGSRLQVTDSILRKNAGYGLVLDGSELTTFTNNELSENTLGAAHTQLSEIGYLSPENNYAGNTVDVVRVAGGRLASSVVVHDLGIPYQVGSVDIRANGRFRIEPGVEILFEAGRELAVQEGVLEARGTADRPIILAGVETVPGFWKGIGLMKAPSTENILEHVRITDAGSTAFIYAGHPTSIYLSEETDRLAIRHTTVDRGKGYALLVRSDASFTAFENNVLTGHELGAALMSAATANDLDEASSYSGNAVGKDFVQIRATNLTRASTWSPLDVPYRVQGSVNVKAGGHLTIAAGTEVQFAANSALEVSETTSVLSILGTESARVRLTRTADTTFWKGVWMSRSTSNNRIEHTDISFGGETPFIYFGTGNGANLSVDGARVSFQSVRLQNGNNYGLAVRSGNQLVNCDEISYVDNASGDLSGTPNCS